MLYALQMAVQKLSNAENKGKVEGKIELLDELGHSVSQIAERLGITETQVNSVLG